MKRFESSSKFLKDKKIHNPKNLFLLSVLLATIVLIGVSILSSLQNLHIFHHGSWNQSLQQTNLSNTTYKYSFQKFCTGRIYRMTECDDEYDSELEEDDIFNFFELQRESFPHIDVMTVPSSFFSDILNGSIDFYLNGLGSIKPFSNYHFVFLIHKYLNIWFLMYVNEKSSAQIIFTPLEGVGHIVQEMKRGIREFRQKRCQKLNIECQNFKTEKVLFVNATYYQTSGLSLLLAIKLCFRFSVDFIPEKIYINHEALNEQIRYYYYRKYRH
ncbi:hypothetical protein RF11_08495 [Thelohanellus kitauei]|uniref:Uncharacterized protein n=1 Tax=Thelohanellus kitauei TaxID=669202 RepID=A0A0C2NDA9_THEKT|nr:hypothetical protein RF11_08495 [Thelohanellus kitauei]